MATQNPVDLFTDKEREVASILLELPRLIRESAPQVLFENLRRSMRRRRTQTPYEIMSESERAEPSDPTEHMSHVLQNKTEEGPTSPDTPLCPRNSSCEEQFVAPPAKPSKKKLSKKERLMEKKEEVALLSKEKEDLTRELSELHEKYRRLRATNFSLKDCNSKLSLNQLKPVGIRKPTNKNSVNFMIKLAPPPQPPLIKPATEKPKGEFNLNFQLNGVIALDAMVMVAPLTFQLDIHEKAAKSAQARKRRLEILRGRRTSSARKQQRVQ